jgi:hypothetical protein
MEALPPSGTAIRDQYVGLGQQLTELRLAVRVTQLEHGGPHSVMAFAKSSAAFTSISLL